MRDYVALKRRILPLIKWPDLKNILHEESRGKYIYNLKKTNFSEETTERKYPGHRGQMGR